MGIKATADELTDDVAELMAQVRAVHRMPVTGRAARQVVNGMDTTLVREPAQKHTERTHHPMDNSGLDLHYMGLYIREGYSDG